jgi:hypothetical protein
MRQNIWFDSNRTSGQQNKWATEQVGNRTSEQVSKQTGKRKTEIFNKAGHKETSFINHHASISIVKTVLRYSKTERRP